MFVNYVLYPEDAEVLHNKYALTPVFETDVGVLGHVLYNSFVKEAKLLSLLRRRTAQPFYACYTQLFDLSLVAQIYEAYLLKETGVHCELQFVTLKEKTYVYPVYKGNYLYFYDDECLLLRDLSVFTGRALLSVSAAALSFCEEQGLFPDVREQYGVYTCDAKIFTLLSPSLMMDRQLFLQEYVAVAEQDGFYAVAAETTEAYVALELASAWNIPRTITPERVILHYKKEETGDLFEANYLGLPFAAWVAESIARILAGKCPVIRVLVSTSVDVAPEMIAHNVFLDEVRDDFLTLTYEKGALVQVPVFDLDDYRVFERVQFGLERAVGDEVSIRAVAEPLSFTEKEGGWLVVTRDENSYFVLGASAREELVQKWKEGAYFSLWGRYCLSVLGIESVALLA